VGTRRTRPIRVARTPFFFRSIWLLVATLPLGGHDARARVVWNTVGNARLAANRPTTNGRGGRATSGKLCEVTSSNGKRGLSEAHFEGKKGRTPVLGNGITRISPVEHVPHLSIAIPVETGKLFSMPNFSPR
jgi:hypothetical protein